MLLDKPRILVVDDEENAREVLQRRLAQSGYQCTVASNTVDAGELLKREAFSLMLLDITMPGQSGIDYLPEVVAQHRDTAIVMLTAVGDTSIAVRAMREGAYDYITKPVAHSELIFKVERALERRATTLQVRQYQEQLESLVAKRTDDLEQQTLELSRLKALFQGHLRQGLSAEQAYNQVDRSPFRSFKV